MIRGKDYDPLDDVRRRLTIVEHAVLELRQQRRGVDRNRPRYAKLRGARARAIRYLVTLNKLTLEEIAHAFGISKQRVSQITKTPNGKTPQP